MLRGEELRERGVGALGRLLDVGVRLDEDVGDHDVGAGAGQREAVGAAQAARAAGDDGNLAGEVEHLPLSQCAFARDDSCRLSPSATRSRRRSRQCRAASTLAPWAIMTRRCAPGTSIVDVVVEVPKGSRNKFEWDPVGRRHPARPRALHSHPLPRRLRVRGRHARRGRRPARRAGPARRADVSRLPHLLPPARGVLDDRRARPRRQAPHGPVRGQPRRLAASSTTCPSRCSWRSRTSSRSTRSSSRARRPRCAAGTAARPRRPRSSAARAARHNPLI